MKSINFMKIPWQSLSDSALSGLVQEFVTREGTEYGLQEVPLEAKASQVLDQLRSGEVEIVYDEKTQTTSLSIIEP